MNEDGSQPQPARRGFLKMVSAADPQKLIPGNLMPFSGVPDATERADIVACLATLE